MYLHFVRREIRNGSDRGDHHYGHHHITFLFSNLDTFGEREVLLGQSICCVVRTNSIYLHNIILGMRITQETCKCMSPVECLTLHVETFLDKTWSRDVTFAYDMYVKGHAIQRHLKITILWIKDNNNSMPNVSLNYA